MSATTLHPLASDYLRRLRDAARGLSEADRRELLMEIEAHLAEATTAATPDVEVLAVLERLGTPQEIVQAQAADAPDTPPRPGVREWLAIALLLIGGVAFGVGWVVGVVLLWGSRVWSAREKWLATLVIPGGVAIPTLLLLIATRTGATARDCTSHLTTASGATAAIGPVGCRSVAGPGTDWLAIAIAVVLMLIALGVVARLAWRARIAGRNEPDS